MELLIYENFEILKNWNGEEDLFNLIKPSETNNKDSWINRCLEELNRDIYLRMHPLLLMFAKKGFRHVDVIKLGFSDTSERFSYVMVRLLGCLVGLGMIPEDYGRRLDYENAWYNHSDLESYDSNLLESEIVHGSVNGYTYGNALATLIGSEGEAIYKENFTIRSQNHLQASFTQLFVLFFFIKNHWYRDLRIRLTHGSTIDRYHSFAYFFKNCIDLDLMGLENDFDLNVRADIIFDKYKSFMSNGETCKEIVLLDGHGRMLRRILTCIINRISNLKNEHSDTTIDKLQIKIYEVNIANHLWHEYIFPQVGKSITFYSNVMTDDVRNDVIQNNGIIYLNFSGIGNQEEMIIDFIRKFKTDKEKRSIVVSFCVSRAAHKYLHTLVPFLENEMGMVRPLNKRDDFVTYYFP